MFFSFSAFAGLTYSFVLVDLPQWLIDYGEQNVARNSGYLLKKLALIQGKMGGNSPGSKMNFTSQSSAEPEMMYDVGADV